jgi:hypothetical protein
MADGIRWNSLFALAQAVPQGLANSSRSSQAAQQSQIDQPSARVMQVATGGANLRVRTVPNGEQFITCLEDKTPISITQYSIDRQWTFVASQQTAAGRWSPINGWVRTQYVGSSHP